ncbi:hypothetical protein HPB50_010608 [Hyalomma asiaticum]|uniref:Uncharacterized protein n=1 Tax=Hyalomma asiaticum TaxID=266040 RepID=A0ACB7RZX9_HYAAI|nr:hypothetical protein HPB50_010608 [Hyalomma asiaticum]
MTLADAAKRADAIGRAQACLRPQSSLKLRRTINLLGQKPADLFIAEDYQGSCSSFLAAARSSVELEPDFRQAAAVPASVLRAEHIQVPATSRSTAANQPMAG